MSAKKTPTGRQAEEGGDIFSDREALFASNQDFLDSMLEGYQVLDFSWRYLYLNEAALRHSGKAAEELLGRRMMEVYPGIENSELFSRLEACMRERRSESLENEFVYPDGARRWFELRVQPVAAGLSILSLDLTEGRRVEEERRNRQRELEAEVAGRTAELVRERELVESMLEGLPGILLLRDAEGRTIRSNHGLERVTGYGTEELESLSSESLGVVAKEEDLAAVRRSFAESGRASFEASIRSKSGERIPHYVHIIKTEYRGLPATLAFGFDISAQKRSQAALKESERRTRLLSQLVSTVNSAATAEEVLRAAVKAMGALSSYPICHVYLAEPRGEEGILLKPSEFWQAEDDPRYLPFRSLTQRTTLRPGEPLAGLVYTNRAPVWLRELGSSPGFRRGQAAFAAGLRSAVGFPVLAHDEVVAVLELFSPEEETSSELLKEHFELVEVQIRTALERIGAEERLRRLSAVVEQSPIGVLIADLQGLITYVNPELSRMTGFSREELLGHDTQLIRDRIAEQGRATESSRAAFSGQTWSGEFSSRRKDGSRYWEKVSIIPIKDEGGKLDSIVSLREEITEAKLREDAIREEERSARLIKAVALAANEGADLETLLGKALASVAEYAGWPLAHVYLARRSEEGGTRLHPSPIWYRARDRGFEAFMEESMGKAILPGQGFVGEAYSSGKTLWLRVGDEGASHLRRESARAAGIVAALARPFVLGDSVYAVFEFYSTREMSPEPRLHDHLGQVESTLRIALARRMAEEKLKRLSEIVEQSPTGVVTLDSEGRIDYLNARFLEMTGYAPEELLGQGGELLGEGIEDRELFRRVTGAMAAGKTWRGELLNTRKDGTRFWERAAVFPVRDAEGRLLSFVTLADDVTELKEFEERLTLARAEAERANKAKSDFLAAMSHEIRTPLNAVIGLTNLALKNGLEPRLRDYLLKIRRSSQLLLDIINDVLDFSRIEAGKIELESLSFELEQSLQSLWTIVSLRAAEKELAIVKRLAPELPRRLVGDPHRLGQVLLNLLNNAVKFTSRGEVVLSISLLKREADRAWLRFSVRDTGIGMSPEQLARIFKPFGQAEGGTSRKFGGSGLGLVISERLITLMGGRMLVASEPGRGSEFSLNLPFGLVPEQEAVLPSPRPEWRRLRILVAEAELELRESLRSLLEALSFRVGTAASAEELLPLLSPEGAPPAYDLLLLDSRLGGGSGLEVPDRLRARPGLEGLPFVLMGREEEREALGPELERRGSSAFLAKPASPSVLLDLILGLFSESPEEGREGQAEEPPAPREELRGLKILLAEDNEINQEVALGILAAQGMELVLVEDGFAALDRLAAKDYDAVLMDLQMPRMGGIAATRHIRADPALDGNLVIAMTADVFAVNEPGYAAAGFDGCLFKPIDEARLLDTLELLVRARRERGIAPASRGWEGSAPAPGSSAAPGWPPAIGSRNSGNREIELPPIPGFELEAGLGRLLGNRERYRALLFKYAETQAESAAELGRSLARGEGETALSLAHKLKGMSANLGARELPSLLAELEAALRAGESERATALAALVLERHEASLAAIRGWRARVEAAADLPRAAADLPRAAASESGAELSFQAGPASACLDLGELVARLEGSDTAAGEAFGALRRSVPRPSPTLEERLARLESEIGDYDYEEALRGAAALERELGCAADR